MNIGIIQKLCSELYVAFLQLFTIFHVIILSSRDYMTYMLTLVLLYLMFPAYTMFSCYDSIYKHFKKIHYHRVMLQFPPKFTVPERLTTSYGLLFLNYQCCLQKKQCYVGSIVYGFLAWSLIRLTPVFGLCIIY